MVLHVSPPAALHITLPVLLCASSHRTGGGGVYGPFITSDGCLDLTVGTKEGYSEGGRSMYRFPAHTHCLLMKGEGAHGGI